MGSKSFASRARDSDPTLSPADQILAVADTLLAGDRRIGNNQHDWYAILRVAPPQGRDSELIANQYRNLALVLNPQKNKFPFAEQAFRLVVDAWSVLSNPSRKTLYDKELAFYLQPQQQQPDPFGNPNPAMHQNFMFFGGSSSSGVTHTPTPAPAAPQPQTAVHFSQTQVHANSQPQIDPVGVGSTREPQNFMNFTSGSNLVFGSASGSKPIHGTVNNKQTQESYPIFAGNVTTAAGATQEQVNNNQTQQNYSNIGDKTAGNVNVNVNANANASENVGERTEVQEDRERTDTQGERVDTPANGDGSTMWTACPYCYYMYEYPSVYADCTLRCQNCKKAFQAVAISSPPPSFEGQDGYFCCWGFLPLGFSPETWRKNKGAASSWTPFSPMFTCPQAFDGNSATKKASRKRSAPRVYIDDDEVFVEISEGESDDGEWHKETEKRKKKAKVVRGKGTSGTSTTRAKKAQPDKSKNVNEQDVLVSQNVEESSNKVAAESSKKGATANSRKQPGRVAKNFGKLDLNVEFSNEPEESAPKVNQENEPGRGEDENIEGIGFFEGLDEFLSSLPILNVVGDDKVVKAA